MTAAAIPTFGRVEGVDRAIESLLRDPDLGELIVVDQNTDGLLDDLVASIADPRLRHVKTDVKGAGHARNLALATTSSDVLCLIDDDCEAEVGWAATMTEAFDADPTVGCVFSEVLAPEGAEGFTPARSFPSPVTYRRWRGGPNTQELGIGASYALRLEAAAAIDGWDPAFGPGGRFPSSDDIDIAFRMMLKGWAVHCTPSTSVVHHGSRSGAALRDLNKRDYSASGALFAKLAKTNPGPALLGGGLFLATAFKDSAKDSFRARRPAGIGRWFWTLVGFGQGLRVPVAENGHFRTGTR